MAILVACADAMAMLRRTVALTLWVYFAWYLAAMLGTVVPLPAIAAPVAAIAMGGFALVDWRRIRATRLRVARHSH
jgi:hypothetical protein